MQLRYDFHVHSHVSPCAKPDATIENYLKLIKIENIGAIGFADHLWDENVRRLPDDWFSALCTYKNIEQSKKFITNNYDIPVYFGCEVDVDKDGIIGLEKGKEEIFDYILFGITHYHNPLCLDQELKDDFNYMKKNQIDRFMLAVNSDYSIPKGIAHPFLHCGTRFLEKHYQIISDNEFIDCFKEAAKKGVSIEISVAFTDKNPKIFSHFDKSGFAYEFVRMISLARECGCKFHYGSDSHSQSDFLVHDKMEQFVIACGVDPKNMLTKFML